jgi:hypothetical protein
LRSHLLGQIAVDPNVFFLHRNGQRENFPLTKGGNFCGHILGSTIFGGSVATFRGWSAKAAGCRSSARVILLAVGWYLRLSLAYRDAEELLQERGISVDHVTLWRWVQRCAPEPERRLRQCFKLRRPLTRGPRAVSVARGMAAPGPEEDA